MSTAALLRFLGLDARSLAVFWQSLDVLIMPLLHEGLRRHNPLGRPTSIYSLWIRMRAEDPTALLLQYLVCDGFSGLKSNRRQGRAIGERYSAGVPLYLTRIVAVLDLVVYVTSLTLVNCSRDAH